MKEVTGLQKVRVQLIQETQRTQNWTFRVRREERADASRTLGGPMRRPWRMTERDREIKQLIREHGGAAVQFAHGLAGNSQDAKELVQDALYRVLSNWQRSDPGRPIKPWFFAILRNCFVDSYRESKRHGAFISESRRRNGNGVYWSHGSVQDSGGYLEELIKKETAGRIRAALERIRPKNRTTLMLRDLEGDTYEGVARKLRVPTGTVRSRLHRARRALRRRLEDMEMEA